MQTLSSETQFSNTEHATTRSAMLEAVGESLEIDALRYPSISVQLDGTFTGTVQFEVSNDGDTWLSKTLFSTTGAAATEATAPGMWTAGTGARFFRVRVSALTDGAVGVHAVFSTNPARRSATVELQDAAIAGRIADDASATRTQLNATIDVAVRPQINTLGVLGDSITSNGYSFSATTRVRNIRGYWDWTLALLQQRLQLVAQGGVSGENTSQMIARLTPYLAVNPYWNVVMAGINDILQDVATPTIQANLTNIWNAIEANGGRVIAVTVVPLDSGSTAQKRAVHELNGWIRRQSATRERLMLADAHMLITGNSGGWAVNLSNDGLHPTGLGSYLIGSQVADIIAPWLPSSMSTIPIPGDPTNLVSNPAATGTSGTLGSGMTGQTATGFAASGIGTSSAAISLVQRLNAIGGNYGYWHHVELTSGGIHLRCDLTPGGGWAAGDVVYGVAEIQFGGDLEPTATGQFLRLKVGANNTSFTDLFQAYDLSNGSGQPFPIGGSLPTDRVLMLATQPFTIPSGVDRALSVGVQSTVPGSFNMGRVGIWKLGDGPLYHADYSLFSAT